MLAHLRSRFRWLADLWRMSGEPWGEREDLPESQVTWELVGGQRLTNVHPESRCAGGACVIHNPSAHHMADWPQNWRGDRRIMERICPHGLGHPDPDETNGDTVHGCDGCCRVPLPTAHFDVV